MVLFGGVELAVRLDFGDDRCIEDACSVQLRDVGFSDARLVSALWEYSRAILRAAVGTLPVKLSWIMRDREVNP